MYAKLARALIIFTMITISASSASASQVLPVNDEVTLIIATAFDAATVSQAFPSADSNSQNVGIKKLAPTETPTAGTEQPAPAQPASTLPAELNLVIASRPGGPTEDIFFRIIGDGTTTSIPLYIRQTGGTEISGVQFFANLTDVQGQQLSGASFNLVSGGIDVTATGITIPAGGKQVLATLNVANLTATGAFSGSLVAQNAGKLIQAAVLKGERFPLPSLKFVGASDAGVVNRSSKVAHFSTILRLESANAAVVKDLKITVDSFTDPDGNQIPVSWTIVNQTDKNALITVHDRGSVDLEIVAELPTAGEYTGAITLLYAEKRETTTLKVARTRTPPTISILGLATATGETDLSLPFTGKENVKNDNINLWMTLKETAGQTVTLNLPQLTVLSLKGADENTFQAQFDGLKVYNEDDTSLTEPFILKPGDIKHLKLNVNGLHEAGAYTGKLTLTAPDATAIDQDITILVKESAWIAGLWIFFSAMLSFLIGIWLKKTRPRLDRQRYVSRLLSDLDREARNVDLLANGKDEVTLVVEDLRRRLEDIYDESDPGAGDKSDDTLKEIDQKISLLRRLASAVQQVYGLKPQKLVARFIPDLRVIYEQMLLRDLASVQTASDGLKKLFVDIETALKDELLEQLEKFEKNVKEQIPAVHEDTTSNKLQEGILARISKARNFAQGLDLTAASLELKEIRVEYARVMADDLGASLDEIPFGFDQSSWLASKQAILGKVETVQHEADGERAITLYQEAYAHYLTTLTDKLLDLVRQDLILIGQKEKLGQITAEQGKSSKDMVNPLISRIDKILLKIKERDLSTAREEYQNARDAYVQQVKPELDKNGIKMDVNLRAMLKTALVSMGLIPDVVSERPAEVPADRRLRERQNLGKLITLGDAIISLVAIVAAVAFGLQTLWAGNATWGGFDDHLVAFLWGLGLYQLNNQGVKGILDVINTWQKPPTQPGT